MSRTDARILGRRRVCASVSVCTLQSTADIHRTAKQCYHCQGLGHVQADCPTLRLSGAGASGRCYACGQPGHLAVSSPIREAYEIATDDDVRSAHAPTPGFNKALVEALRVV